MIHIALEPKIFWENKINFLLNSYLKVTKTMKFVFVIHISKLLLFWDNWEEHSFQQFKKMLLFCQHVWNKLNPIGVSIREVLNKDIALIIFSQFFSLRNILTKHL